ncbi:HEXXH motif domain-containing protein [Planomonospora sp. ID67723]|uniref:HEXXH motif domain-containing protein n=1 Tax=Planomonospora sp. ID67723 TaxID=2738134 RepID=UPI0018C39ED7|nr:HEXXH motif domain-containing protein [Planomonospora sp. ID67723]MBG0830311.1 HEXXH motif domain-containing protein [Planomonospora sp. ID67723]
MKLPSLKVSGKAFTELAAGGGGAEAAGELRALQRDKTMLLVRGIVDEARTTGHPHADLAVHAYDLLSEVESRTADAVVGVLGYPAVGAWAWRTYLALTERTAAGDGPGGPNAGGHDPGRLGAMAVVAAIRSQTACRVRLPVTGGRLMLPSLGEAVLPRGPDGVVDVAVRPDGIGAELGVGRFAVRVDPSCDGTGWRVLHRLPAAPGIGMILDDLDPYRWPEAHELEGRLTAGRRRTWRSRLVEAWRILTADHWTVAEEVASAISVLTPLRPRAFGDNSGTAQETFGAVALSEPGNGLGLGATFAHEIQHTKLTALTDAVALTLPDDGRRHYAPWRPDPRPVYGLLQGAYAFMGVADFWRCRRGMERGAAAFRAQVEFARWREGAYLVTCTLLESESLTEAGVEFVTGMRRTLEAMLLEPVDLAAAGQAHREAGWHRDAWNRRNPGRTGP